MGIDAEWCQVLLELTLLASGPLKAQKLDGKTSPAKPGSTILEGEVWPDPRKWAARWERDPSERTLEAAKDEIRRVKLSPSLKNRYVINTLEWKEAVGNASGDAKDVSRRFGVPLSTVYMYRKQFGGRKT